MKFWKWIKKCPMLFLVIAGWFGLIVYTWSEGKLIYALNNDPLGNPVFTALLEPEEAGTGMNSPGISKGSGTDAGNQEEAEHGAGNAGENDPKSNHAGKSSSDLDAVNRDGGASNGIDSSGSSSSDTDGGNDKSDNTDSGNNSSADTDGAGNSIGITRFKKYKKTETDSQYYTDPGKKALTTDYDYQEVEKGYFDDALFIGDSRTVGMQDYSGLEHATFFAKNGLNVYELLEEEFITDPETGSQVGIPYMLKKYQYGKIYFMIGINELGTGNTGTFQKAYRRVLEKFRKWQPQAVIYIQGIIPVSRNKSSSDTVFNNININDKNVAIAQLADGKDIFYLDVSSKLKDKDGYLREDYTFDDVHMYAQYYGLWTKYLMKHAVVR